MDPGEAAVLGSAVTGGAVVLAGLLGAWAEGRRSVASEKRAQALASADRIRAFRREQIRQTETVVSEQLQAVRIAMTSRSGLVLLWRAWRLQKTMSALLQTDLLLIGEIDAYVALAQVCLVVGRKFPIGPYR